MTVYTQLSCSKCGAEVYTSNTKDCPNGCGEMDYTPRPDFNLWAARTQGTADATPAVGSPPAPDPSQMELFPGRGLHVDGHSGNSALERQLLLVLTRAFTLWKARQRKYGSSNIAAFGSTGCLVRSTDKLARLRQYYVGGSGEFGDEAVVDTWLDLLNYAAMGLLCHEGNWPESV